jgi:putative flippase GtrA
MLGTTVQDAQCGFKAMRAQTARQLLPMVKNDHWFFDTELLVVAQRSGLRIHELPVDWTDDPDTRVAIVPTAIEDLRGVWRLSHQVRSFAVIGILSTAGYVACYGVLRDFLSAESANVVSLLLTAIGNTAANRRFTFNAQNNGAASRDHLAGLVAFAAALAISSASLVLLDVLAPSASRVEEIVVLVAAGIVGTALRFVLLRSWIKPRVPTVVPRRLAPGKVPSPIGKQTREAVLQKTA